MQDLDQASLQLLLIREPFSQRVSLLLLTQITSVVVVIPAPVPAELFVERLMRKIDEQCQAFRGEIAEIGSHQNFSDLIEVPRQRQVADLGFHQVEVLAQQHRKSKVIRVSAADFLFQGLDVAARMRCVIGSDTWNGVPWSRQPVSLAPVGRAHHCLEEGGIHRITMGEVVVGHQTVQQLVTTSSCQKDSSSKQGHQ